MGTKYEKDSVSLVCRASYKVPQKKMHSVKISPIKGKVQNCDKVRFQKPYSSYAWELQEKSTNIVQVSNDDVNT